MNKCFISLGAKAALFSQDEIIFHILLTLAVFEYYAFYFLINQSLIPYKMYIVTVLGWFTTAWVMVHHGIRIRACCTQVCRHCFLYKLSTIVYINFTNSLLKHLWSNGEVNFHSPFKLQDIDKYRQTYKATSKKHLSGIKTILWTKKH